jgi:hypothetical protein
MEESVLFRINMIVAPAHTMPAGTRITNALRKLRLVPIASAPELGRQTIRPFIASEDTFAK